jgi:hypothetical protein
MVAERYEEPAEPTPDPELIEHYSWVADPKNGASEKERGDAVAALVHLCHERREQVRSGELLAVDFRLLLFIRGELERCIRSTDPLGAVELLLSSSQRVRGRPKTPHRDFVIAGDVAEKVAVGMTIEAACADVAMATSLSEEEIRRIYFREKKADKDALEMDLTRRKAEKFLDDKNSDQAAESTE